MTGTDNGKAIEAGGTAWTKESQTLSGSVSLSIKWGQDAHFANSCKNQMS